MDRSAQNFPGTEEKKAGNDDGGKNFKFAVAVRMARVGGAGGGGGLAGGSLY